MRLKVVLAVTAAFAVVLLLLSSGFWSRPREEQGPAGQIALATPTIDNRFHRTTSAAIPNPVVTNRGSLLPPASLTWQTADDAPEFASFADWASRFRNAGPQERAALEPEGVALAQERRDVLTQLIQSNPERALELTIPYGVRQTLPPSVESLLEERVSARADVMVIGAIPLPGREREIAPMSRSTIIGNDQYETYTFGWWLDHQISAYNVPVNGVAVSGLLALSPHPVRLPDDPDEEAALEQRALSQLCTISTRPATLGEQKTVVEVANEPQLTCSIAHALLLDAQLVETASASASIIGGPPLVGFDNYTTGRKRFLIMRPGFSDVTNTMTDAQVPGHFSSFSNNMYEMSYGKLIFAGLGQGSDVTPIMKLPGVASDYDNTGLGKLYDTCKGVAQTNYGFNIAQYDFLYVVTGSVPAAGYAGLGFVRGVGFHLANGYYGAGTASHEYGHNLGLNHANFWSTLGQTIIGNGNSIEYGDGNDPMGAAGPSPQHYNSRYKNYLTWIQDADIAVVSSANSGTFRLYSHDLVETPGYLRGLKIVRSASQNYWVHFRQRFVSKAMQNGVQLLWTGNANQSSLLLDTRLENGSADNTLAIGRTFSDTALGIHITPISKGHTYPESIDVVVNVGTFAGNLPPTCVIAASTTSAGVGQTVSFSATASDPNGDALAYYWDFGDGDYSVENNASTSHSFAVGEYVVQCTVSDRKGGTARDSVVIRVGGASNFHISGRVLKLDQQPLPGIKIAADSAHAAISDSDGTYTIPGLAAGSYTLTAIEPVSGSPTFIHPFFANPVTVGPSLVNMDFIVGTAAPPVTLVATGAVWKYLDNGTDQGTAWQAPNFNESGWGTGAAQLGYGENDEATVISYGGNANNKFITYYFRRGFNVANAAALTNIVVSLLRDDGGVVYLNGVEIFRSNMPTGPVTYNTFASAAIDDQVFFSGPVPAGVLVSGTNMLAVEIHQADLTSSDVSFDLKLAAEDSSVQPQGTAVYLTSPEANAVLTSPTNITLNAVAVSTTTSFTNVQFFDGGTKLGEAAGPPFAFAWNSVPPGNHTLTARAQNTSGQTVVSALVKFSVVPPSTTPPAVALSLIQAGAFWKYLAIGTDAPSSWAVPGFDDSSWAGGFAELGYGEGDEATVVPYGGNVNNKWITSYYRHPFTISDPGAVTNLTLHLKRDDGAVVYLNGLEILRDNIPTGPVAWGTLATNAADDGQVFFDFALSSATLTPGTNLLAVEVHQTLATSSDVSFDLGLDALASTNRPRGIYLVSPIEGATIVPPDAPTVTAQIVAGGTLGVTNVEFFADGTKVGEDRVAPFSFIWATAPSGSHQIIVVATDSAGGSITSAPVNIVVVPHPLQTDLVSAGEVWKYLDDGSVPPTTWRARTFDDGSWDEGPARLGYGGDGEVTTVSFGNDPNNKHITTYFRHLFTVANPAAFTNLRLRLIRDDGAVVYLNGAEVFRSNMATGLISANSLAVDTVNAPDETTFFETTLSPASLLTGSNVLAVEVHQAAINSSDLGFDLAFIALTSTNFVQGVYLASPGNGAEFELPVTVSLSAVATAVGGVSKVEFFDGANKIGQATAAPFTVAWTNPPTGSHLLTAVATDNAAHAMTSPAVNITVAPAPLAIAAVATTLIPSRATWTYLDNGSNQGSNWTARGFNDISWKNGVARFGYGLDGEFTKISNNIVTHYFRKWFTVTDPAVFTELLFRLQRDDGALVYLNGQEIYRSNMPTGAVNSATLAATTANSLDENYVFETFIPAPGLGLLAGSNVVAVELHQSSATSSDAGFDLEVWGIGSTEPRVYLSNPAEGATVVAPVQIDAQAWAGTGRAISKVEFFEGANKIGEASGPPFSFTWANANAGTNRLSAVATDNGGRIIRSAQIGINVFQPPLTTTLVATGSVWKYLDNGSNELTAWSQRSYDDSTWAQGPAELGYNNEPATIVGFGPDPSNKYITTYLRRWFYVPADGVYTNLNFRLKRDDGAVVYLNGSEMFRSNMPNGTITYQTLASSAVVIPDEETFFPTSMRASNLVAGANILAVEVHQNVASSGDLGFDIELVGVGYTVAGPPMALTIERTFTDVKVSWPINVTGWNLYSADTLTPGAWSRVTASPAVANGFNVLSVTPGTQSKFYQLRKP